MDMGKAGIVGVTLKPEALNCHVGSQLLEDLESLRSEPDACRSQVSHKEEANAHKERNKKEREALKSKVNWCIHPLMPEVNPKKLVNLANGT